MELKKYQKRVINDLTDYLSYLPDAESLSSAYRDYWESKQVPVGVDGIPAYQNIIESVPHVCYKVPTGGGKTLLACASVKPIFDAMSIGKHKAVVWLVPSDAILTQTLTALKNPNHLYRQQLNLDFSSRVEVYSKDELLVGQNFTPTTVAEQLSVMVLSYDSFRSASKEGRKAFQANGALAPFRSELGPADVVIDGADETALVQIINQLNPVVIVDESHHARSDLSKEMLNNFNPAFVLDLTATPKNESNIISYVDALALKAEHMVKLPVVVYHRSSQDEVVADAIDIRNSLENLAVEEQRKGGDYIRPITLFQAQPKTDSDSATFEKIRAGLVKAGIPSEQIAIKTANINELRGVDLLSPECPIRYIITVNALKEGWDCPFAYVLASLANKTSTVDVEQILGRILRQPHARKHEAPLLNTSYVLSSSNDFQDTIDNIVQGLNFAGFTGKDYRVVEAAPEVPALVTDEAELPIAEPELVANDPLDQGAAEEAGEATITFDPETVSNLTSDEQDTERVTANSVVAEMLDQAEVQSIEYEQQSESSFVNGASNTMPNELHEQVNSYSMNDEFVEHALQLRLPQFYVESDADTLFGGNDGGIRTLLTADELTEDFTLRGQDYNLDLAHAVERMVAVDVREGNRDKPKAFQLNSQQQERMRKHWESLAPEQRVNQCVGKVFDLLDKRYNEISASDLKSYVKRVVENLDKQQLSTLENSPHMVAEKLKAKIDEFLAEHRSVIFERWLDTGNVVVKPTYQLPARISLANPLSTIGKSLFDAEDSMGIQEREMITRVTAVDSVSWWHRIPERAAWAFRINGPIVHFPDFMIATKRGKIVIAEYKGEHLKNQDSRLKIKLGQQWSITSGANYHYYMVFQDGVEPLEGGVNVSEFLARLERL